MKNNKLKKIFAVILTIAITVIYMTGTFTTNAATLQVEEGIVDLGRGEAQIVINGNEGQTLVGKTFQVYRLFDVENSEV